MDFATVEDTQLLAIIAGSSVKRSANQAMNRAISELYDRYSRLVYTIAIHVVGDPETAEEITQDVFVRACDAAGTYRSDMAKVSSWLVSIARHRSIDELRRRGARPEKDSTPLPDDGDPNARSGQFTAGGLEETVELTLQQQCMRQILQTLPPDQRRVLSLAYFKGLSHSEIASLLGEPLGTVKSRIRASMQKVRDSLIEQGMMEQ